MCSSCSPFITVMMKHAMQFTKQLKDTAVQFYFFNTYVDYACIIPLRVYEKVSKTYRVRWKFY